MMGYANARFVKSTEVSIDRCDFIQSLLITNQCPTATKITKVTFQWIWFVRYKKTSHLMNVTLEKYRENLFEVNNRHIFMVVQIVIISLDFVRFDRGTNEMCAL